MCRRRRRGRREESSQSFHFIAALRRDQMPSIRLALLLLSLLTFSDVFGQAPCPVEEDPVQLAECAQLDVQAIIQAAKGNLKLFCNLAERYMECFKTKTRNCIGGWVSRSTSVRRSSRSPRPGRRRWFYRITKSCSMVLRQSGFTRTGRMSAETQSEVFLGR